MEFPRGVLQNATFGVCECQEILLEKKICTIKYLNKELKLNRYPD